MNEPYDLGSGVEFVAAFVDLELRGFVERVEEDADVELYDVTETGRARIREVLATLQFNDAVLIAAWACTESRAHWGDDE